MTSAVNENTMARGRRCANDGEKGKKEFKSMFGLKIELIKWCRLQVQMSPL
jgi:hypothetical protein